ncbi:MAG: hypothetical protein WAZ18_01885 [Alphaproteobacteria bacterium]
MMNREDADAMRGIFKFQEAHRAADPEREVYQKLHSHALHQTWEGVYAAMDAAVAARTLN